MLLLGITGEKQHGKGTLATIAQQWAVSQGVPADHRGFADYVKWSVMRLFFPDIGMDEAVRLADLYKENAHAKITLSLPILPDEDEGPHQVVITVRQALQHEGTEVGRMLYDMDFWVDLLLEKYRVDESGTMLLVSDMRFDNEASAIDYMGGYVYKIVRPGVGGKDDHSSEAGVSDDLIDRVFINDGSIEDLRAKVIPALEEDFGTLIA